MSKILGLHIPAELKNLAINGNMDFWQRVETNTTTQSAVTSVAGYTADMIAYATNGTSAKSFTVAQSTNVPTQAQSGYQSSLSYQFTSTVALATLAATDFYLPFQYKMEGLDYQKIHGKVVTFGFWFNASVAGVYSFAVYNAAANRTNVSTFTAASGWQYVTMSIQMDNVNASWVFTNAASLLVNIGSIAGSTFNTSTYGVWAAGQAYAAAGAVNWAATAGATINVAQLSIVEGPLGFSSTGFQRAGKDYQQELALCQRYYEKSTAQGIVVNGSSAPGGLQTPTAQGGFSGNSYFAIFFTVEKRTIPTFIGYDSNAAASANTCRVFNGGGAGFVSAYSSNASTAKGNSGYVQGVSTYQASMIQMAWTADAGL